MRNLLLVVLVAVLGLPGVTSQAQEPEPREVTLFVSYIPSVQFAPLYVALERGYFADEGLAVEVEHSFNEADGVDRLAVNDLQFGIISGEQVLVGRAVGKPLVYVYEWFHNFPVGIVAPEAANITTPEDLRGLTLGIPGPFGASFMGLQALLAESEIDPLELRLESIGFTAPEAVCTGLVDAAVVYISNEPLTIEQNCFSVSLIAISDYVELISNGLVTNETTLENEPDLVAGMVRAIQRGVLDTLADADAAFEISLEYVPDLPESEYATQRQVLENSLALWTSEQPGMTTLERWQRTLEALEAADLILAELSEDDLESAFTNVFIPVAEGSE
ncbi:MAG: ABC transporter substrate-binding protein [Anaerolineae bacterium]|nr:ABC transporter substrate-binding protein [Anaerolineae bacterium]